MKCRNPFFRGLTPCPCGQCLPCRINRRRMWTHRIMLEANQHEHNCFVTLTYDDESMPVGRSLAPRDLQLWLKRIRKAVEPQKLRFYGVGEYGDQTERPHYHVAMFGMLGCRYVQSRKGVSKCCDACELVRETWGKGIVHVGTLEADSAQYVSGYVVKKMTRPDDYRLYGRHPEFCRMSRRPGIGLDAMYNLADRLMYYELKSTDLVTLRHGGREMPLGRYLREKLNLMCGEENEKTGELNEEVLAVLEAASRLPKGSPRNFLLKEVLVENGSQYSRKVEAKVKLYNRRSL